MSKQGAGNKTMLETTINKNKKQKIN